MERDVKYQCAHRWVFKAWGGDLERSQDTLLPVVGREVTVRVTHCGMCHSDLHIRAGGFDMGGGKLSSLERSGVRLPLTLGHEIVGEVVEIGPDVTTVRLGQLVIVYPWIGCAECPTCLRGDDHLCVRVGRNMGLHVPGGYADVARVAHERYLVALGTLEPARAATFACAGITALSAIRKLPALTADDWVAVMGCGGVGMTALALLSATSPAKLIAIDPDPVKRASALQHGATVAYDPHMADAIKVISKACSGNIAAVVDFVGAESSASLAVNLVRRAGQVVMVGLFGGEFRIALPMFALKSLSITGSYVGSLSDLRELVELAQRVALPEIPLDLRPLSSVNQALDDLSHGRVLGRVILQP